MSHEALAQPSEIQRHLRPTVLGYKDMTKLIRHLQKPETIETQGLGRCLFIQAFVATAFTLWLTFDEVLQLKGGHFRIRKPSRGEPSWFFSISVHVPFCRSGDPLQANVYYRIQPQADEPHTCVVTKLLDWVEWTVQHEKRPLDDDDFLFPYHTRDNLIQLKEPFSVSMVLRLINGYASDNTWNFNVIKWWGGWPENVPAEVIVRYLLDESQDRASFGNVMSLERNSFQGHTGAARRALEELIMRERIESAIQSMESKYMSALTKIENDRQDIRNERDGLRQAITELRNTVDLRLENVAHALATQASTDTRPLVTEEAPVPDLPQQPQKPQRPQVEPREQASPPQPPRQRRARVPPLQHPEQIIPDIMHWKEAILQWEKGDRANGLTVALSKWTTDMKKAPQHKRCYKAREKIVKQYKLHGQDGRRMRKEYGDKMDTVDGLLAAIDLRIKRQRKLQKK
ncbi:hypothetical protein BG000_004975 [Podila horticola]|nr:hypothetical protein BG000_004975 [Podila horticola]